ncbi:peroxidasin homolog [Oculina patagonica]
MQCLSFLLGVLLIASAYEVHQVSSSASSGQLVLDTLNQANCDPLKQRLACFKRMYRTFDGTCNNLCNIAQGSAESTFVRFVPPAFQNGQGPRIASVVEPLLLENARTISNIVFLSTSENAGAAPNFTHMTMAWGSFIDHDFTLTASNMTQGCGTNNEPCPTNNPGCIGIPISQANPDDRLTTNLNVQCIPLSRSTQRDGEQINLVSSYMDGSNIYGANCQEAETVRDQTSNIGLIRVVPLPVPRSDRMPISPPAEPGTFCRSPRPSVKPCFLFADFRDNENPTLMTLHILITREHNRIAHFLHNLNPTWHDERIFQEARKIVIAHLQHITYNEWLPTLFFSEELRRQNGILLEPAGQFFNGYDPNGDATTFNSLAAAAFRMGHSLIRESFGQFSKDFIRLGEVSVTRFFDPSALYKLENNGIDGLHLGLVREQAQLFDRNFAEAIHESLIMPGPGDGTQGDLLAINIQRGRDHGLPPYIDFRAACGGGVANTFADLNDIDLNQLARIKKAYVQDVNNIDAFLPDVDLYVGGVSENPQAGSILGQTFTCIIARTFQRYRVGDRFWYERNDPTTGFTLEQLDSIRQGSSLAKLICDNSDNVKEIQPNVFEDTLNVVHCDDIPSIDLNLWKEEPGMEDKLARCGSCS